MNLFLKLTTRNKLFFGFGLTILLLVGVIAAMQAFQKALYNRDFAFIVNCLEFRCKNICMYAGLLNIVGRAS